MTGVVDAGGRSTVMASGWGSRSGAGVAGRRCAGAGAAVTGGGTVRGSAAGGALEVDGRCVGVGAGVGVGVGAVVRGGTGWLAAPLRLKSRSWGGPTLSPAGAGLGAWLGGGGVPVDWAASGAAASKPTIATLSMNFIWPRAIPRP
jgi:hypothetical protein